MVIMCPETRAMLDACRQSRKRAGAPRTGSGTGAERVAFRNAAPPTGISGPEPRLLDRSAAVSRLQAQLSERTRQCEQLGREFAAVTALCDDALVTTDGNARIRVANAAARRLFGADDIEGLPLTALVSPSDAGRVERLLAEVAQSEGPVQGGELRARHRDGRNFPAQISGVRVHDADRFVCMIRDISERRVMQRELVEVAEYEKRQIGQELHDSIGQQLTGLRFYAEMLAQSLAGKSLPEAEQAQKLRTILETVGNQVRELSHGLMPTIVDGHGLARSLAGLAADVDYLDQFECEFVCYEPAVASGLGPGAATQLYRIAQEATQNAIRHSQGNHIRISLESADDTICLQVVDNGVGIAESSRRQDGGGIRIMQHRAALIGAGLRIETGEGRGTTVQCRLGAN
jgi:two-component system, LuxR family, sensor kinase FixL